MALNLDRLKSDKKSSGLNLSRIEAKSEPKKEDTPEAQEGLLESAAISAGAGVSNIVPGIQQASATGRAQTIAKDIQEDKRQIEAGNTQIRNPMFGAFPEEPEFLNRADRVKEFESELEVLTRADQRIADSIKEQDKLLQPIREKYPITTTLAQGFGESSPEILAGIATGGGSLFAETVIAGGTGLVSGSLLPTRETGEEGDRQRVKNALINSLFGAGFTQVIGQGKNLINSQFKKLMSSNADDTAQDVVLDIIEDGVSKGLPPEQAASRAAREFQLTDEVIPEDPRFQQIELDLEAGPNKQIEGQQAEVAQMIGERRGADVAVEGKSLQKFNEDITKIDEIAAAKDAGIIKKSLQAGKDFTQAVKDTATDLTVGISTRLTAINPILTKSARDLEFNIKDRGMKLIKENEDFISHMQQLKKTDKEAYKKISVAIRSEDDSLISKILDPQTLQLYKGVRKTLDGVQANLRAIDDSAGQIENFFPRTLKDSGATVKKLQKEQKSSLKPLSQLLDEAESHKGSKLSNDEVADIINSEGVKINAQAVASIPGKPRAIKNFLPELADDYDGVEESLLKYYQNVGKKIELEGYMGKNASKLNPDSLPNTLAKMLEEKSITPDDATLANELMKARHFPQTPKGRRSGRFTKLVKDTANTVALAQPDVAVANLAELIITPQRQGILPTIKAAARILTGNQRSSAEDVMVRQLKVLRKSDTKWNKAVRGAFEASGFAPLDRFVAAVNSEATLSKLFSKAKSEKGIAKLQKDFGDFYTPDGFRELVSDLNSGQVTDVIKRHLFHELSEIRPTTKLESSVTRNNGSAASDLGFSLLSWTLKMWNQSLGRAGRDFKKGNNVKAAKDLIVFLSALTGAEMGVGYLRDAMLGRDPKNVSLAQKDAMLRVLGVNKYDLKDGAKGAISGFSSFAPLDITSGTADDVLRLVGAYGDVGNRSRITRNIPVFGKSFHYWFGGGAEASNKHRARENREAAGESKSNRKARKPRKKVKRKERKKRGQ